MRNELFVRLDECGHEYGCLGAGDGEILEEWRMERPGKSQGSPMTMRKREPWVVDFKVFLGGIQLLREVQGYWKIGREYDEESEDGAKMRKRPNSDPSADLDSPVCLSVTVLK